MRQGRSDSVLGSGCCLLCMVCVSEALVIPAFAWASMCCVKQALRPVTDAGRDLKLSNLLLTHDGTLKLCGVLTSTFNA